MLVPLAIGTAVPARPCRALTRHTLSRLSDLNGMICGGFKAEEGGIAGPIPTDDNTEIAHSIPFRRVRIGVRGFHRHTSLLFKLFDLKPQFWMQFEEEEGG